MIFECSWEFGEFSVHWKLATTDLIFKKGKEDPENYRRVSLTSVTVKIMEIIQGGLDKHVEDTAVIGLSHHRFVRGKSSDFLL